MRTTQANTTIDGSTLPNSASLERRSLLNLSGTAGAPGNIPASIPQANYGSMNTGRTQLSAKSKSEHESETHDDLVSEPDSS